VHGTSSTSTLPARDAVKHLAYEGCRLSYRVAGSGPPVLLIQGVGLHGEGWTPQTRQLSADFRCLTFDNRGMGASQPCGRPLSVEQMAADALALMDAEGWDSAHLVGHSLGGLVAQHLALAARQRVRSLALLCTVSRGRDATRMTPRVLSIGIRSSFGTLRTRRRAFLEIVMSPAGLAAADTDALAAQLEPLFGHDLAIRPPVVMKQLGALRAYDSTPRLAELAGVPTLVVGAAHDPIAPPRFGRALARAIPGARYVEFDDAAHGVVIERAERVNALLCEHFQRAGSRAAG